MLKVNVHQISSSAVSFVSYELHILELEALAEDESQQKMYDQDDDDLIIHF